MAACGMEGHREGCRVQWAGGRVDGGGGRFRICERGRRRVADFKLGRLGVAEGRQGGDRFGPEDGVIGLRERPNGWITASDVTGQTCGLGRDILPHIAAA